MIIKIISAVMAFVLSVSPFGNGCSPEQKCNPEFSGTFIQSWMSSTWDNERWQTEIEYMKQELRREYLEKHPQGQKNYLFDHMEEELAFYMEQVRLGKQEI